MTDDLANLNKWLIDNKSSINVKMTKFLIFSKQKIITQSDDFSLQIENSKIERVNCVKYLNRTLDEHLNWNRNVTLLNAKAASCPYIFKTLFIHCAVQDSLSLH